MAKVGTLSWMERTGGKLAWRDRLTLIGQGIRARIAASRRIRAGTKLRLREVEDILPPDSALIREATAICMEASAPFLFNHCLRAYFWARLLDDGTKPFDDEALFTAFLLHDLGITDRHRLTGAAEQCFTIVGARMAEALGAKHGWPDKRARLAAEAITLHLNVVVGDEHGREARLLRTGSGADVAGLDIDVLHADQIAAVAGRYPRLDFKREVIPPLAIEMRERPCCRIAFLQRALGFRALIRDAPMFAS